MMVILVDACFANVTMKSPRRTRTNATHAQGRDRIVIDVRLVFSFRNLFRAWQKRTIKKESDKK